MSDFNSLVQYTVENISRPIKYIIYKLTEFIRVVDKFVFRQVPSGAASGYATIEQIEGNTVAWNQLVQNGDFGDGTNGWSSVFPTSPIVSVTDGILKITKNAEGGTGNWYANTTQPTYYSTHKYYIALDAWNEDGEMSIGFAFYNAGYGLGSNITINVTSNTRRRYSVIGSPQTTGNKWTLRVGSAATPVGKVGYFDNLVIHDLTAIFGAGNEPTTVADFEAWMAQNGLPSVADYNAGELLSVKMSGIQTEDSSQQTIDTLPFDVTTITGINTATNVREVIFPNGMKQANYAGTVKDELDFVNDTATVKVGSRAYQAGDESDTDVITDGTTTYYALTTPITYTDLQDTNGNPLNPRYKVEQGGTEQVLPVNTSTPTTVAPTLTTTYTKDNN